MCVCVPLYQVDIPLVLDTMYSLMASELELVKLLQCVLALASTSGMQYLQGDSLAKVCTNN